MSKYIDADAFLIRNEYFADRDFINPKYDDTLRDLIDAEPTADVVEVVRCKECKHYQFADNRAFGFPVKRCEWTGFEDVDDNDFCSRGEKRDG